jgi:hypothetical protein
MATTPRLLCMRQSIQSMTMPHCLPLDGDLRDARRRASVHHFFERYYHRVSHILSFKEASSRRFSVSDSFFHLRLMFWKDALSRVMDSPMSFFETTVRIVEPAAFPSH